MRRSRSRPASPRVAEAKANGEASDETGSDPVIPADRALDFMADLLRILGENSFDVGPHNKDEIEAFFETWARHLLVGVAPPNRERVVEGGGCAEPLLHAS